MQVVRDNRALTVSRVICRGIFLFPFKSLILVLDYRKSFAGTIWKEYRCVIDQEMHDDPCAPGLVLWTSFTFKVVSLAMNYLEISAHEHV